MHRTLGRGQIASRIDELSTAFKDGASKIRGVTMHTPRDPRLSAGISCFDVAGLSAEAVTQRLTARKFRTTSSPYKTSHARVATGVMNTPAEIERVLEAIRQIAT
jgi:selenocysteine lyase/cysteine desulfurase